MYIKIILNLCGHIHIMFYKNKLGLCTQLFCFQHVKNDSARRPRRNGSKGKYHLCEYNMYKQQWVVHRTKRIKKKREGTMEICRTGKSIVAGRLLFTALIIKLTFFFFVNPPRYHCTGVVWRWRWSGVEVTSI